jgi:hypothetical protein
MKDPTDDHDVGKGFDSQGAEGIHKALKLDGLMEYSLSSLFKRASFLCSQQIATELARFVSLIYEH